MTVTLMNLPAVDAATEPALARGIRVFNGALFGADEAEHVAVLLEVLDPDEGAMVLDAGSGIGEMARLMHEARPDLQFLLVNASRKQLDLSPEGMDTLEADFHAMPLPDACADAIIFSFALCHSPDPAAALREARRVLKPGGVMLINDLANLGPDYEEHRTVLGADFHAPEVLEAIARAAGFRLDVAIAPGVTIDRMDMLLAEDGVDTTFMDDTIPTIWRFTALDAEAARWERHKGRIAFQFSGGRDSTAALYLLRGRWPEMTVYHVDTGDQFPETARVVKRVLGEVLDAGGDIRIIETDVAAARERDGWPSDLVPTDNTPIGAAVSGEPLKIVDRYACCASNLMNPLHARMREDGITLIVRGTRADEYATPLVRDGEVIDGQEFHYPVEDWSAADVMRYFEGMRLLKGDDLPLAPFYAAGMKRAPECMGCTAWWDEGRTAYLKANHPAAFQTARLRLSLINTSIALQMQHLTTELEN